MSRLLSEVLFNRALIWIVMASMVDDNNWLRGMYFVMSVFDVARSLKALVEEDA